MNIAPTTPLIRLLLLLFRPGTADTTSTTGGDETDLKQKSSFLRFLRDKCEYEAWLQLTQKSTLRLHPPPIVHSLSERLFPALNNDTILDSNYKKKPDALHGIPPYGLYVRVRNSKKYDFSTKISENTAPSVREPCPVGPWTGVRCADGYHRRADARPGSWPHHGPSATSCAWPCTCGTRGQPSASACPCGLRLKSGQ